MKSIKRRHVLVLHLLLLLFLTEARSQAAIWQAKSLSAADVQSAINGASAGDTVVIPAGSTNWTTNVTISIPITVQGAGVGLTTITSGWPGSIGGGGGELFTLTATKTNQLTRLTGMSLDGNETGGGIDVRGSVIYGLFRIDHVNIIHSAREGIEVWNQVAGVIDHCTILNCYLLIGQYYGTSEDTSWQMPITIGTTNTVVTEDCVFSYAAGDSYIPYQSSFEHGQGARICYRHNTWTNFSTTGIFPIFDMHGNQGVVDTNNDVLVGGGVRGTRQTEFYNNIFDNKNNSGYMVYYRGGVLMVFSNKWVGPYLDSAYRCSEEDGTARFNLLSSYPGYDMHWLWSWNNTGSSGAITSWYSAGNVNTGGACNDSTFLLNGTNMFFTAPSATASGYPELFLATKWKTSPPITNYTPLVYPHPLVSGTNTPVAGPVISQVAVSFDTNNVVTVAWITDTLSSSIVNYGTSTNYGTSVTNVAQAQVVAHAVKLQSFVDSFIVHYQVKSIDMLGNVGTSTDTNLPTPPPANFHHQ